jgi:hypothetical protein
MIRDLSCALADDHVGCCSSIDPEPGEPVLGSLGPVRCGQPVEAFDHCDRRRHYVRCDACSRCPRWHVCWDAYTRYHAIAECPNAHDTIDGAWRACQP